LIILKNPVKSRLTLEQLTEGIYQGDRVVLGQAITLVESSLATDQELASTLLNKIIGKTGNSVRIGITGVPGVGKSTFIESFGKHLTDQNKKIAVLTIDPSSQLTKGSILGDKTRMEELSKNPNAFIRPTASGNMLGGVGSKTREAMLLCEAAGYEVIIVETVGVGQSEVAVKNMVDFFLLLMLAGAGDELQGIKKGIMEMADALVITKADGDNVSRATEAQAEYQHALHLFQSASSGWSPKVVTCSALHDKGITDIWTMVSDYVSLTRSSGFFDANRTHQNLGWFNDYFEQLLKADFRNSLTLLEVQKSLNEKVSKQVISPYAAAHELMRAYHKTLTGTKS
jgi:LAO/AO transport system kinase